MRKPRMIRIARSDTNAAGEHVEQGQATEEVDQEPGGPDVAATVSVQLQNEVEDEEEVDQERHHAVRRRAPVHQPPQVEEVEDHGEDGQDQQRPIHRLDQGLAPARLCPGLAHCWTTA